MNVSENEYGSLSFKPHAKLYPDPEWKIMIPLDSIMHNNVIFAFINDEPKFVEYYGTPGVVPKTNSDDLHGAPRKFTDKELHRILADCRAERRSINANFDDVIDAEWAKIVMPPSLPEPEVTRRARADQLIRMGVPSVKKTIYYRDFNDFMTDVERWTKSMNDTIGDVTEDYTVFTFTPVAAYTDYTGTLQYTKDDDIMMIDAGTDVDAMWIFQNLWRMRESHTEVNHISMIYKSTSSHYDNYYQYAHQSPSLYDENYIRFTWLLND